ncbi:hypothetical protein IW262DRAFT_1335482, partial [Armillaria fumosa]
ILLFLHVASFPPFANQQYHPSFTFYWPHFAHRTRRITPRRIQCQQSPCCHQGEPGRIHNCRQGSLTRPVFQ